MKGKWRWVAELFQPAHAKAMGKKTCMGLRGCSYMEYGKVRRTSQIIVMHPSLIPQVVLCRNHECHDEPNQFPFFVCELITGDLW